MILSGVQAIARALYGDDSPATQRRVRRLIAAGTIPTKKVGGRHEARPEWLDAVHDSPDPPRLKPNGQAEPVAAAPVEVEKPNSRRKRRPGRSQK
jgi:hypothetical protein